MSKRAIADAAFKSIPSLKHSLERVLQVPEKLHPFTLSLTQPKDFDFTKVPPYRTSGKDPDLETVAASANASFYSSTSSFTSLLTSMYLSLSNERTVRQPRFVNI